MSLNVPAAPELWHFWAENTETLLRCTVQNYCLLSRAQAKSFVFFLPNHYLCSFTWNRLWIPLMHLRIYISHPGVSFSPCNMDSSFLRLSGKKVSSIPSFSGFWLSLLTLRNASLGVLGAFWNEMCRCRLLIHLKFQHFLTGENLSLL